MSWIKKNLDIIIPYAFVLLGFLGVNFVRGIEALALAGILVIVGTIVTGIAVLYILTKHKNKLRLLWLSPLILFFGYMIFGIVLSGGLGQ